MAELTKLPLHPCIGPTRTVVEVRFEESSQGHVLELSCGHIDWLAWPGKKAMAFVRPEVGDDYSCLACGAEADSSPVLDPRPAGLTGVALPETETSSEEMRLAILAPDGQEIGRLGVRLLGPGL
ncbi:MAG TPA: hypothetical protein VG476_14195 [Acidimicrobiales bacterium]|nr:hypothetical protein [Acidimicrobiales bacterium]